MKKAFVTLLFLSVNIFCFALPNIKLYFFNEELFFEIKNNRIYSEDDELVFHIHDGKLYDVEEDEYMGTIAESKESAYNAQNQLTNLIEYDNKTGAKIKETAYDDTGAVKTQTSYDKNSGNATERLVYNGAGKKPENGLS